ncbi:hypothetical protein NQ315_007069, partial [Exocentrus adspersus]
CYERLAIGQRLNQKNVYKHFEYNTLQECQAACTKQQNGCRAFSFGIGTKGNGTCELSSDPVKETADLKPIGTVPDTDYDLYIKKLGCSVVVEKNPYDKPPPDYPETTNSVPSPESKPSPDNSRPNDKFQPLENGYPKPPFPSNFNNRYYLPPTPENVDHVQTLVSVASGPNSYLHPVHDILVGDRPYMYGVPNPPKPMGCCEKNRDCCAPSDLPPYRPPALNHPYDPRPVYRPKPDDLDQGYGRPSRPQYGGVNRPYDRPNPPHEKPNRPDLLDRPDRPYDRPSRPDSLDRPDRPYDGPSRPDSLDRPYRPYDRPSRPDSLDRPDPSYDRPSRPDTLDRPYGRPTRPYDESNSLDRPDRPYERPIRPDRPYDGPNSLDRPDPSYSRPQDLPYDTKRWDSRPDLEYDKFIGGGVHDRFKPGRPYDERPPKRPLRPEGPPYDSRPNSVYYDGPLLPKYGSVIPHPDYYDRTPGIGYQEDDATPDPDKPSRPSSYPDKPSKPPTDYPDRPSKPPPDFYPPSPPSDSQGSGKPNVTGSSSPGYQYDKPTKPFPDPNGKPDSGAPYPVASTDDGYGSVGPDNPNGGNVYDKPGGGGYGYGKPTGSKPSYGEKGSIVSTSIGPHGEQITSIITELKGTCFRRVLAGKRAARRCVRRSLTCETVEQCQRECAEEKYFICEGFNYRYDPTGRGKGDCELLDLPLSQLDIGRDLYPDPDYDYYERDRNAASVNCKQWPSAGVGYYPSRGGYGYGNRGSYASVGGRYSYDYGSNWYPIDRRYDGKGPPAYKGDRGPSRPDYSLRRPGDRWVDDDDYRYPVTKPGYSDYDNRPNGNRRGDYSFHHSHSQDYENSRRYYHDRDRYDYKGNRGIHYLPAHFYQPPYEPDRDPYKQYEPYLPPKRFYDSAPDSDNHKYYNRDRNWSSYGNFGHQDSYYGYKYQYNNRNRYDIDTKNYYLPPKADLPKGWGLYGGTYGNGGNGYHYDSYGNKHSYDYWGIYKYDDRKYYEPPPNSFGGYLPEQGVRRPSAGYLPKPPGGSYLPKHPPGGSLYLPSRPPGGNYLPSPPSGGGYLPSPPSGGGYFPSPPPRGSYLPKPPPAGNYLPLPAKPGIQGSNFGYGHGIISTDNLDNSLLPAEPRRPPTYDFIRDECSLRSAAGFRLHKGIVKKFYAVPNIYECELLCFKEKQFHCTSYAYRYTISLAAPTDNCYLSNRDYKELDYYTDLEPDRDFDIYTMNNKDTCEAPIIHGRDNSECFWRVRSGQRLAHKVVRDSLTAKSIVECQLECLRSTRFTCRAFSYRYGSPVIGGVIDNCQLTDWPYYELDPLSHFVPESGFEIYERGSFGHGCEPDHFTIGNKLKKDEGTKVDQLCYVGFGSPARLLPQATKKTLFAPTELDCKAECSQAREGTLFQCMSFSYRSGGPKGVPNCQLSDILQRDLLPNVDYVQDPDYWLFAWDNYSPECINLANRPVHDNTVGKEVGIDERYGWDIFHALDTWRVYSVSGWPCRRGSLCQENREAGFWFCELEGGDKNSWDYCCRPDHQCGASDGYRYQWCYVGPAKTQWRKCNDRYYPYVHNVVGKVDISKLYLPVPEKPWRPSPYRAGARPDRPPAPAFDPPPTPSLDEYEKLFDNQFLDPPKPGGFGGFIQARHWPVSYLHKEMPPNHTDSEPRFLRMETKDNPKYAAIQNLIQVIKNNDLNNVQYHISNESNNANDILFVKIPLPTNFTKEVTTSKRNSVQSNTTVSLESVYSDDDSNDRNEQSKRSHKALVATPTKQERGNGRDLPYQSTSAPPWLPKDKEETSYRFESASYRPVGVYRRGFVTRTNNTQGRLSF